MHGVNNPRNTEWNNEMVTATDHVTPEWKPSECRGTHMHILKNVSALCRAEKTNPNDEWKYAVWLVSCRVNAVAKSHTVWKPERLKREQSAGWRWTKRSIKWNRCCCTLLHVSEHAVSLFITLLLMTLLICSEMWKWHIKLMGAWLFINSPSMSAIFDVSTLCWVVVICSIVIPTFPQTTLYLNVLLMPHRFSVFPRKSVRVKQANTKFNLHSPASLWHTHTRKHKKCSSDCWVQWILHTIDGRPATEPQPAQSSPD